MGTDIHFIVERKGRWSETYVQVYVSDDRFSWDLAGEHSGLPERAQVHLSHPFWDRFASRNYAFFGVLAGVRGETRCIEGPMGAPGLPSDACTRAREMFEDDLDAHSWGYCPLRVFFDAHAMGTKSPNLLAARKLQDQPLSDHQDGFSPECMEELRVIYWFDN